MDCSIADNQALKTHEDKVILNFCFSKTFSGNPVGPIRRVLDPFGVHLVGVLMSPQCLVGARFRNAFSNTVMT